MKLAILALSAALLAMPAGAAFAQSNNNNGASSDGQKSDDCAPGMTNGNDMAVQQSLRCKTEEKTGTDVNNQKDVTGSTDAAPQRKHNMNDTVPAAEQP